MSSNIHAGHFDWSIRYYWNVYYAVLVVALTLSFGDCDDFIMVITMSPRTKIYHEFTVSAPVRPIDFDHHTKVIDQDATSKRFPGEQFLLTMIFLIFYFNQSITYLFIYLLHTDAAYSESYSS